MWSCAYFLRYVLNCKWDLCSGFLVAFNWRITPSLMSGTRGLTGSDGATEAKRRTRRRTWPRTWTTPQPVPAWRRAACPRTVWAEGGAKVDAPFDLTHDRSGNRAEAAGQLKCGCGPHVIRCDDVQSKAKEEMITNNFYWSFKKITLPRTFKLLFFLKTRPQSPARHPHIPYLFCPSPELKCL